MERLNGSVFNSCDNLVSASFPALKFITGSPFNTNANLTKLYLPATSPTVAANPFKSSGTIYFVDAQGEPLLGDVLKAAHDNYKAYNDGSTADATWYKWVLGAPEASWEASDGSKGTDTLYNAVKSAAKSGGKVKLLGDYEYEKLELRFTKEGSGSDIKLAGNVTLDLAGYTINSTSKYTAPIVFDYTNNLPDSVFTIVDSSEGKTGTIKASQGYIVIAGIDALPLKMEGGTYISGCDYSTAIIYENQNQNEAQLLTGLSEAVPNGYIFDPDKITVDTDTCRAATEKSVKVVKIVPITGVSLNKPTLSLEAGKRETLTATIAPTTANNKAVTWKTSNPANATVDENGEVTAVAVGSATITVTTTDGGKTATCAVTVTAAAAKPAPGGKLEAPLTQDKVDDVFGEGNATLDNNSTPPKITINNSITPEKPIEIETDVTIDLGGNTITGKPGQPGLIVGDGDTVTIGGGTISGGDNSSGAGGNGITGGTDSDIIIDKGTTVEGGDGTIGGDGINSDGNVIVDGTVNGGDGSSGNGGDGVDTSGSTGNITIKPDGSATGGNSTGGNGNGGNGTSSGGNTTVEGDVNGGNGNGSGTGGNGATGSGGNSSIEINNGGSASGGNGGNNGGVGGDGIKNNVGDVTVSDGGTATGGNGGNGATGGNGGDGIDSGTSTVENGGKAEGGNGGDGTNTGGTGGDGSNSSGNGEIDGSVTGGNGGNGGIIGGNGGHGAASGTGSGAGDINIGGSASGGTGGSGTTTGGTGGDGAMTGGDINVETDGSASGGNGGASSTDGGTGGNGTSTSDGGTTVNGNTSGGNGGNGSVNGNGGDGGNGSNQNGGTIGGNGTASGGNGGNAAGTGTGGAGGSGVGGGANSGSVTTENGINGRKAITDVDDSKSGTTVKVADESKLADAALTETEKQDPAISEVKVVLSVEKKNNEPDKSEVENVLSSVAADTIGAFFDITLDKIITNAGGIQPLVVVANASEEIEITITIPSDMRGGSNYVVIRVHNGTGAALATTQSGDDLTFKTDKFSTYAIAYTPGGTTPPTPPTPNPGGGSDSGSGSGSGGSSGSIVTTPPTTDKSNNPTQGEITVDGKVDSNGKATISITDKVISDAINKAQETAKKNSNEANGVELIINVNTGGSTAGSVIVNLPKSVQEKVIREKVRNTTIAVNHPSIRIGINLEAMTEMNKQANADIQLSATSTDATKLSTEARNAIGSRPAFELKATYANGSKSITNFGSGTVSVAIPYILQNGEVAGGLYAVYVDENGKVSYITNSSYDADAKLLRFCTNYFSVYGIGYKTPIAFNDIANHWAKMDIEFVVNRGLMSGINSTSFEPNTAITRGMFVTALGRLAGVDTNSYKTDKFTDVKADAYYAPYVNWAVEKGITNGTTATTFSPDNTVTRQEMAVFMTGYAKAMGYKVPKPRATVTFADNNSIGSWAAAAVKQMQMAGVLNGKNNNTFDPKGTGTRGEIAAMLHRYMELIIDPATAQGLDVNDSGSTVMYESGKMVKSASRKVGDHTYNFDSNGEAALPADSKKTGTYTVLKGDSFWLIAKKVGCTMAELERLNGKNRNEIIYPGEVLKVPQK